MKSKNSQWCVMPVHPLQKELRLTQMTWGSGRSSNTAALMLYIAILVEANGMPPQSHDQMYEARVTYDVFEKRTGMSRALIARGVQVLKESGLAMVDNMKSGNCFSFGMTDGRWSKLPRRHLLNDEGEIRPFKSLKLRARSEFDALKLYLLILSFRKNETNTASIGYEKIHEYAGIPKNDIRNAISQLINLGMITLNREFQDLKQEEGYNRYLILGLQ